MKVEERDRRESQREERTKKKKKQHYYFNEILVSPYCRPIKPQDEDLLVKDLLLGNGVVDVNAVPFVLPLDILARLKVIPNPH